MNVIEEKTVGYEVDIVLLKIELQFLFIILSANISKLNFRLKVMSDLCKLSR